MKGPHCHIGILQGSNHVEKAETSEYCSFHWCYAKLHAIRVRMDAERNTAGICQRKPWHKPDQPGGFFLCNNCYNYNDPFPSYWMWQKVLPISMQITRHTET